MKKISYTQLQQKYPLKVVALDKKESKVVAAARQFKELFQKLNNLKVNLKDCIFVGPIQKKGTINVYFSLREKNRR